MLITFIMTRREKVPLEFSTKRNSLQTENFMAVMSWVRFQINIDFGSLNVEPGLGHPFVVSSELEK